VHVALPIRLLQRQKMSASVAGGWVEIQQLVDQKAVTLSGTAGIGQAERRMHGSARIPGSIWRIAYGNAETAGEGDAYLVFWGAPLCGVMVGIVLILLQARRLRKGLQTDQATIVSLMDRALKGESVRAASAVVAELQGSMDLIEHMARKAAKSRMLGAAVSTAKKSAAEDQAATTAPASGDVTPLSPAARQVRPEIFRAYDIRGVVGESLTPEVVYELGRAIGSMAYDRGEQTVIIGRDGRNSGPDLSVALSRGLMASGRDVLNIGMVPTPVVYFATHFLDSNSGVMLTGSHNPPDYNGLKVVIDGETLSGNDIQELRRLIESGELLQGEGMQQEQDLIPDYLTRITEDVQTARPLKVVLDCGNGVGGIIAPAMLRAMGCEVVELYCDVDGDFPNHHPDPGRPENLKMLISKVQSLGADLGLALDGDGDRIGVVDSSGRIIWPDRLLMLFARDVLSRQPGADVIYDVKSSRHLASEILSHGGRPLMWKTGHSLIKAKMKETGALLAGEMSGHIFFRERWYGFDDGIYSCARLLEILSADPRSSAEVFDDLPDSVNTPELNMEMTESSKFELIEKLSSGGFFEDAKLTTIDGVRVEFEYGWGLIRASNTTPAVVFRFEAEDVAELEKIQGLFRQRLLEIDPELKLPF
jgi:phosphomannomutase/phosphoglucomutase